VKDQLIIEGLKTLIAVLEDGKSFHACLAAEILARYDAPVSQQCKTCRFYKNTGEGYGNCRRRAPTASWVTPTQGFDNCGVCISYIKNKDTISTAIVEVVEDSWCGEYEQ
jgi:hypothetical protein